MNEVLLPADLADERISELLDNIEVMRAEIERTRAKLMPMHFITAPEAINYLQDLALRLDSAHERRSVEITVLAIKRLSSNTNATIEGKP